MDAWTFAVLVTCYCDFEKLLDDSRPESSIQSQILSTFHKFIPGFIKELLYILFEMIISLFYVISFFSQRGPGNPNPWNLSNSVILA